MHVCSALQQYLGHLLAVGAPADDLCNHRLVRPAFGEQVRVVGQQRGVHRADTALRGHEHLDDAADLVLHTQHLGHDVVVAGVVDAARSAHRRQRAVGGAACQKLQRGPVRGAHRRHRWVPPVHRRHVDLVRVHQEHR